MSPCFNLPTLVTLTAPTCAGKSYLLELLVERLKFNRIVSTTDRAPRADEVDGVHYHFISTKESKAMEAGGKFAELVTYNGVRYGVTHDEMADKMRRSEPPIVILEPSGVDIYREYCAKHNWRMFSIYVLAEESVRLERLNERTSQDIIRSLNVLQKNDAATPENVLGVVRKEVATNNKRMKAIFNQERVWITMKSWDLVVNGTDANRAIDDIVMAIASRNSRSQIFE